MNLLVGKTIVIAWLHSCVQRASLYERSDDYIWTDDHVGRQMLEFHLNPDLDSASLKHSTIDDQVSWITGRVDDPSSKSLLDIGCGPGLYCERFQKRGFSVTGVDFNPHSLRYASGRAAEHNLPIEYVRQNYVQLDFRDLFDVVTLINRDFGALIPAELDLVLSGVRRSLKRGGLFVFDTLSVGYYARLKETSRFTVCNGEGFWSPGPHIVFEQVVLYPEAHVELERQIVVSYDGTTKVFHNWLTYNTAQEIRLLLLDAGFKVVEANPFLSDEVYDDPDLYLGFVAMKL